MPTLSLVIIRLPDPGLEETERVRGVLGTAGKWSMDANVQHVTCEARPISIISGREGHEWMKE